MFLRFFGVKDLFCGTACSARSLWGSGGNAPEKELYNRYFTILPHFLKNFKSHRLKLSQIFCEDSEYQILMEKSRDTSLQIGENAV
jgi:hypothetical protein